MRIIIDRHAGVCTGVRKAIKIAEQYLEENQSLYALGALIHNQKEIERLKAKGLDTVPQESVENDAHPDYLRDRPILIRAHGISKNLREKLNAVHANIIDGTCVIVRRIQKTVEDYYRKGYQIIIVGKKGHPEILGLLGQCNNEGIVLQEQEDLSRIRNVKSLLISQTTLSPDKFYYFRDQVQQRVDDVTVIDTICRQISNRHDRVREFARSVDVVLFVGGKNSSNTGVLHGISLKENPRSYRIESAKDIDPSWLRPEDTVGITGGASTPVWQLEQVRDELEKMPERAKNK